MTERACIILAAGMGTRLGLKDVPKVMVGLHDKPLLHHTVETVLKTNPDNFIVVTGHKGEVIKRYFGNDLIYQRQEVLNGNAGALREGLKGLNNRNKNVLVLQGDDSAFYKIESLLNLISLHERSDADLTMIFTNEYDPNTFKSQYIPDERNRIIKMVYPIRNPSDGFYFTGSFCARVELLKKQIPKLKPIDGIISTTQIILNSLEESKRVFGLTVQGGEWVGINTPQELERAQMIISKSKDQK